jgi:site-specific DNA-methyltransferase (adenine-specific)
MSLALTKAMPALYGDLQHYALIHGDSLTLLRSFPSHSVDSVVTDPPYAIGFDGEAWDSGDLASPLGFQAFSADWAAEVRRVLKPGGHVLAFGSPRTFHRMVAGCEDIGLEIRDQLLWLHGRGVPKSRVLPGGISTTLKPSYEPILMARSPLGEKTAAANIACHGTGGLNIDATRLPQPEGAGYWPSHVVLSHEERCSEEGCYDDCAVQVVDSLGASSTGELTRLFYVGKASSREREAGLDELTHSTKEIFSSGTALARARANVHPTVKPIDVMRWLVRLVTPPGGLVLDPFTGSGSTGCAAVLEGRRFIGIEREAKYVPIAQARLDYWTGQAAPRTAPTVPAGLASNGDKNADFQVKRDLTSA